MNFIKQNFLSLIILLLLVIVFIGRCSKPTIIEKPTIVRDTVWNYHTNTVISNPNLINTLPPSIKEIKETKYLPDTNYQKLLVQYQNLLVLYLEKNIQKDRLKIDSIGYVDVTDTISKNLIAGRTYTYDLKYPVITTTVTLPPLRRNQFYIGGGLEGNSGSIINQLNAGLLLKNKKDQIFGVYTGMDMSGQLQFGVQTYFKISFRK